MILRIACDHIASSRAASKSVRLGDADSSQRLAGLIRPHLGQRLTSILPPLSHVCILPARSLGGAYHDLRRSTSIYVVFAQRFSVIFDGIPQEAAASWRRDLGASMVLIRRYVMVITYENNSSGARRMDVPRLGLISMPSARPGPIRMSQRTFHSAVPMSECTPSAVPQLPSLTLEIPTPLPDELSCNTLAPVCACHQAS